MRFPRTLGVLAAALLAACGTDAPTTITGSDAVLSADVATIAADAAATDVELMRGPGAGPFGLGLLARPGHFECNREARGGLDVERTCTYKDAAGVTQPAYDSLTTASVSMHAVISGEITRPHWTATVNRVRDFTVSGLAGRETSMTWNGTDSATATRVRVSDGETRTYSIRGKGTINAVMIPVPRTATSWPTSGTITRHVVATRPDGSLVERGVTITFNGTQFAVVTVNGETFEFDLSQRGKPRRR
ncbi:MAG: hypothetical protein IT361_03460 [Gemmatimonadaceae bacterium]|nr:hypothetical protein [Gemmatimonadaceae bacterium]